MKKMTLLIMLICLSIPVACTQMGVTIKEEKVSTYIDPKTGMEFILVKGGCYKMGNAFGETLLNEWPLHNVCVSDFYIGKFVVTEAQWQKVMGSDHWHISTCGGNCPTVNISWNDAQDFIHKLSKLTGKNYRLPTEAEWEYAARSGGKNERWAGTNNESELGEYAWYEANSGKQRHPVGQKKPNGLGLYDMTGNVWELVSDWYDDKYYQNSPQYNPQGPASGEARVARGGSWNHAPRFIATSFRMAGFPSIRKDRGSFRVVMTP